MNVLNIRKTIYMTREPEDFEISVLLHNDPRTNGRKLLDWNVDKKSRNSVDFPSLLKEKLCDCYIIKAKFE